MLAELGVGTVVLCGAERVEKSFWTSKVLEPIKVRRLLENCVALSCSSLFCLLLLAKF